MRRAAALLLLFLLPAVPARADYKDSYRKGIEALDRKHWDDVIKYMREAIADNPTEGERIKLYGLRFEIYLPHFYLGAAYLTLNNCKLALKEFEISRSQGAIRTHPKWPDLLEGIRSCEGQPTPTPSPPPVKTPTPRLGPDPAAVAQAVRAADREITAAEDAGKKVTALAADPRLAPGWSSDARLGPAASQAREALGTARGKLEAGRKAPDLTLLADAREEGLQARRKLEAVQQAASQKLRTIATRPTPTPRRATTTSTPTPAPVPAQPPADLITGAQAYFDGRYQDSIRLLEKAQGLTGRGAAQVRLLQAAARFALYRTGGEKDTELERQAAEDVKACHQADPSLAPDISAFSPQFVAFFRSH